MKKLLFAFAALAGLAVASPSQASVVNSTYNLNLNGMSTGTCPGGICGTVSVTGDTTSSLTVSVDLANGVLFHANHTGSSGTGPFFYFDLTGGSGVTFTNVGDNGSIGGNNYSFNTPASGSFVPNPGNFPGPYDYQVTCTNNTSGKVCDDPFHFTINGGSALNPLSLDSPSGGGSFANNQVAFVADLSVSGTCDTACTAGTGDVGSTLAPAVPEPTTWAMMLLGFCGVGFMAYRRRNTGLAVRLV
jgi:hypothetical protein